MAYATQLQDKSKNKEKNLKEKIFSVFCKKSFKKTQYVV
jgi:hypothetical protein